MIGTIAFSSTSVNSTTTKMRKTSIVVYKQCTSPHRIIKKYLPPFGAVGRTYLFILRLLINNSVILKLLFWKVNNEKVLLKSVFTAQWTFQRQVTNILFLVSKSSSLVLLAPRINFLNYILNFAVFLALILMRVRLPVSGLVKYHQHIFNEQ